MRVNGMEGAGRSSAPRLGVGDVALKCVAVEEGVWGADFDEPTDSGQPSPYGDAIDWDEAKSVGMHVEGSWSGMPTVGDLYNLPGNGAHHSSYIAGALKAGNDFHSIEGFDDAHID